MDAIDEFWLKLNTVLHIKLLPFVLIFIKKKILKKVITISWVMNI